MSKNNFIKSVRRNSKKLLQILSVRRNKIYLQSFVNYKATKENPILKGAKVRLLQTSIFNVLSAFVNYFLVVDFFAGAFLVVAVSTKIVKSTLSIIARAPFITA